LIVAWIAVLASIAFVLYTYVLYPLILRLLVGSGRGMSYQRYEDGDAWPRISITIPAYNEGAQIADTIEGLLALDYPEDRRQILIISDASTDDTDRIVRSYADRGVELLRQPERRGKTAAENLAAQHLTGEIIVNTDASIRMPPHSLQQLVAPFKDPRVGLVSGRDVSVGAGESRENQGEAGYVGYEMWLRDLETRAGGIVGASGCYYAIRPELHRIALPGALSRDFAAALHTHERGYLAVSQSEATCQVPRTGTLSREFPRKVRTMARGMDTLRYKSSLLNPFRHGRFAWMLFSHKVCRWLVPWFALVGLIGLGALATEHAWAAALVFVTLGGTAVSAAAWAFGGRRRLPTVLALPAFALMGNVAVLRASLLLFTGDQTPIWEPTRRGTSPPPDPL
jgi:cellulose synthase/poly-beta-1,6-N-acetylglucosamine synthase-like glycosyltransferase